MSKGWYTMDKLEQEIRECYKRMKTPLAEKSFVYFGYSAKGVFILL